MMRRVLGVAAVIVTLVAANTVAAGAQTRPSFVGTWTMDPAKSVIEGQAGIPDSATRVVAQHGDTLIVDNVVWTGGMSQKTHLVWGTDGKAWKNTVTINAEDTPVTSVLTWEGATLVVNSAISVQGTDVIQVDRWTLSADGRSMTGKRTLTVMGEEIGSSTVTYIKKS